MNFKWLCCCRSIEETVTKNEEKPKQKDLDSFSLLLIKSAKEDRHSIIHQLPNLKPQELLNSPFLELTVGESTILPVGSKYTIYPYGLSGTTKYQGVVYIGKSSQEIDNELLISSDTEVPAKHLCIFFDRELTKFFIKDMCLNTFVKITTEKSIEKSCFISFIDKRALVTVDEEQLTVKIIETDESFSFGIEFSPVIIGRGENCSVKITGKNISREQCTIYYDTKWHVRDGNTTTSKNGTWFVPFENCEVVDGMIFNAGKSIFSIKLLE